MHFANIFMRWLKHRRTILIVFIVTFLCTLEPSFAGEPYENQWGPFVGTVSDANTGNPIPGAVFVAIWMRRSACPLAPRTFFDARVSVADAAGRFEIAERESKFFLFGGVDPPHLDCVAPGYAPYRDVGAQNSPIVVRLRRLTAEQRQDGFSNDAVLGVIPHDEGVKMETTINAKRREMGLMPLGFAGGDLEGRGK